MVLNLSNLANSPLMSQITFQQSSTVRMTTVEQYDYLDRLQSISSAPNSQLLFPNSHLPSLRSLRSLW